VEVHQHLGGEVLKREKKKKKKKTSTPAKEITGDTTQGCKKPQQRVPTPDSGVSGLP